MKKNLGFTRFEFYFVISVVGLIMLAATQRYSLLAEETKRLTFEALAKNFSAAVYNHHALWIMAQQQSTKVSQIDINGAELHFSAQGWPFAVISKGAAPAPSPVRNCLSLWKNLLQNSPSISYNGGNAYGTSTYHLSLTPDGKCRFELTTKQPQEYYFDYAAIDGMLTIHSAPITKAP